MPKKRKQRKPAGYDAAPKRKITPESKELVRKAVQQFVTKVAENQAVSTSEPLLKYLERIGVSYHVMDVMLGEEPQVCLVIDFEELKAKEYQHISARGRQNDQGQRSPELGRPGHVSGATARRGWTASPAPVVQQRSIGDDSSDSEGVQR